MGSPMIDGTQVLSLDALSSSGEQKQTPVLHSKGRQCESVVLGQVSTQTPP